MPAARRRRSAHPAWVSLPAAALALGLTAGCSADTGGDPAGSAHGTSQPATSAGAATPGSTTPGTTPPPQVPESGSGRTSPVAVPGQDTPAGTSPARVVRYTVEVEGGLEGLAADFPAAVRATLTDPRGWQTKDHVRFVNVSPEQRKAGKSTDIRIRFASPALVDAVCAPLRTNGQLSCHEDGSVMINARRWVEGAETYGDDLANYRIYLVNHEVGHSIGHGHVHCPQPGAKAPIMLQQTLRLEGCRPYPYPVG